MTPSPVATPAPENLLTKIPERLNEVSSCDVDVISGGSTRAVVVDEDLIYTNVGGQLLVLEQKEAPFSLQVVGCLQFPEEIKYIRSSDNYVFVFLTENIISVGETEVYVIDATNPKQLTLVSVYEYPFLEPSVNNGYLFAVGSGFRLYVIDVADPNVWYVAGQSESLGSGSLVEIRVSNDYAYVITTLGVSEHPELYILDVSDPTSPIVLGSYDAPLHVITSIAVSEDNVFIVTELDPNAGTVLDPPYQLYILDASKPDNIRQVGFFENRNYEITRLEVIGDYLYMVLSNSIIVLDTSRPVWSNEIYYLPGGAWPCQFTVEGNYAYLAAGPGLRVFDVSRPEKPVDVGVYKTIGSKLSPN